MYLRRRLLVLTVATLALLAGVRVLGAVGGAVASALAPEPVATQSYEVQSGDTLWSIADAYTEGDPRDLVAQIRQLNDLSTTMLQPGQTLLLPTT
jgi:LysM repeat protein